MQLRRFNEKIIFYTLFLFLFTSKTFAGECGTLIEGDTYELELSTNENYYNCFTIDDDIDTITAIYSGFQENSADIELFGVDNSNKHVFLEKKAANSTNNNIVSIASTAPTQFPKVGFIISPKSKLSTNKDLRILFTKRERAGFVLINLANQECSLQDCPPPCRVRCDIVEPLSAAQT